MRYVKRANLAPLIAATLLLAAIASLAILSTGGDKAEAGDTITIEVSTNKFCTPGQDPCPDSPLDTTVAAGVGSTISFQLLSGGHTASQCTDGNFTDCSGNLFDFGSGAGDWLIPGSVNDSNVYFRCNIHTFMQGLIVVGNPTTPTASPTPSPTAAPTATATAAPTSTATPAPTLSGRSDVNCDGVTDGDDVLALLLHSASATPAATPLGTGGCAAIGSADGDGAKGDLNCDGLVNARDALVALYGWAGLPVPGLPQGCLGP